MPEGKRNPHEGHREKLRQRFILENGFYDTLVAIRCFDEGVDCPKLDKIYIMSSETSMRQTVQRRGRVLRKCRETGKTLAYIYDMIILPPTDSETGMGVTSLIVNELTRAKEYARLAEDRRIASFYLSITHEGGGTSAEITYRKGQC